MKTFFFEDPTAVAEYIKKNFPGDVKTILFLADEIAQKRFRFTLRWDMERTNIPVCFENEIQWNFQPADDPEWIFAFNRMRFWITLGQAYALSGDEKYACAFAEQMTHWVRTVKQNDPAFSQCWRSIEVGLRLEYWLKAMQYFKRSPHITEEVKAIFEQSVADHAEFIMGVWNTFNLMSNWGVLANHGLFLAGAMLPETARAKEYLHTALDRLSREARMQVYRDGSQWEQSPMYHNEVLHCYLDVLLLAGRCGISLPDGMAEKVKAMVYVDVFAAKPDHNEISMGDSDEIDQRDQITKGALIFRDRKLKSRGYTIPDFDSAWDMGEKGIAEYAAIEAVEPDETDFYFADSGNMAFRSDWSETATFAHFHCGTLGAGHGHCDKLHFDLFSRGEDVLLDLGRFSYVWGEKRGYYKGLSAHNSVRVDKTDLYVCKDSWESERLARPVNRAFYSDKKYGYAEGGHTGYLKNLESPVFVNRRLIFLKPDILLIADEFYAAGKHGYEQFFHFNNAGELKGEEKSYLYQSERVRAEMVFITPGVSVKVKEGSLSRHYNEEESNPVLETEFRADGFASAYTVIGLSDPGETKRLDVKKLEVCSNFKGIVFPDDVVEALAIRHGGQEYTVVIAHEEYACPTDTFLADGCVGFGNAVVFDRAANESEIGTVLIF